MSCIGERPGVPFFVFQSVVQFPLPMTRLVEAALHPEKPQEYYWDLVTKYKVLLGSFMKAQKMVEEGEENAGVACFNAIQFALKRFNLSGLLTVPLDDESDATTTLDDTDPRSEVTKAELNQIFSEIIELAGWLIFTFPKVHDAWKKHILNVVESVLPVNKGKSDVLRINMYQELFYFLHDDEGFKDAVKRTLIFPGQSLLEMDLPYSESRESV